MSSTSSPLILVTGATGKVGRAFVERLLGEPRARVVAGACAVPPTFAAAARPRGVGRGALQDRDAVHLALAGVTHVLHLATCKETPDDAMDDPRRIWYPG